MAAPRMANYLVVPITISKPRKVDGYVLPNGALQRTLDDPIECTFYILYPYRLELSSSFCEMAVTLVFLPPPFPFPSYLVILRFLVLASDDVTVQALCLSFSFW
jgi:hypothetical protein